MGIYSKTKYICHSNNHKAFFIFKSGICTVEVSIIMPFIFIVCLLMISGMAYMYDCLVECSAVYGAAINCSELCRDEEKDFCYPADPEASRTKNSNADAIAAAIKNVVAADLGRIIAACLNRTAQGGTDGRLIIRYDKEFIFNKATAGIIRTPVSESALTEAFQRMIGSGGITARRVNAAGNFDFIRKADIAVEYIRKAIQLIGGG